MEKNVALTFSPRMALGLTRWMACIAMLIACHSMAEETVGVIYPEVREPFSRIYYDILAGIKSEYPGTVIEYPINGELPVSGKHNKELPKTCIALGSKSLNALKGQDKTVIAAATRKPTQGNVAASIIMKPTATSYLQALISIYPEVKTVHTVYDPKKHPALMAEAREYLAQKSVLFKPRPVRDIRESAQAFREIIKGAETGDAVWLITDGGLIDASVLAFILDAAWEKRLAVFSSNPEFVKRGALFAIYPDNVNLGKRLAQLTQEVIENRQPAGSVEYLNNVHIAYNERTGNHLGLKLTSKAKSEIDLMLPKY